MRRPGVQRQDQAVFAVDPMRDVLLELLARVPHDLAVARQQHVEVLAQPQARQRQQVAGHRAGMRRDQHAAVSEHGVAGEARALGDQRVVVGRVPGRVNGLERPEADALGELHVSASASGRKRRRMYFEQRLDRRRVIGVIVRQHDAAEAAARLDRRDQPAQVLVLQRARVDDPRRAATDDPRVRAAQRQRTRIRRAQAQHVVVAEQACIRAGVDLPGVLCRLGIRRGRIVHQCRRYLTRRKRRAARAATRDSPSRA